MRLYMMQSSAKSLILDWTQSGRSLIKTKNSSGPKTVPWGTPLRTLTLSDLAPSTVIFCVSVCQKSPYPAKGVPSYPIMVKFPEQILVWHAVECFGEVQYYQIMLVLLV